MIKNLPLELFRDAGAEKQKDKGLDYLKGFSISKPHKFVESVITLSKSLNESKPSEILIANLIQSPDPEMALSRLLSLGESVDLPRLFKDNPNFFKSFTKLLGSSNFLGQFLVKNPVLCEKLSSNAFLKAHISRKEHSEEMKLLLADIKEVSQANKIFRNYKYKNFLRITYLNLNGTLDLKDTVMELSILAEAIIEAVLNTAQSFLKDKIEQESSFCILGLGKLGGRELNYSSDIDLIYLFDNPNGTKDTERIKAYYAKLAESISKMLSERTGEGFLYRVDLRLRPDGDRGPICQSLNNALRYYEYAGRTWERSAFLRCRHVAGSKNVADNFMKNIRPFIFKKYLDFGTIEDLKDMKEKISRETATINKRTMDIKNGRGGIREIEFFIHTLQLINGGRIPEVISNNTLDSIQKLLASGIVPGKTSSVLSKSYIFLRETEHAIQLKDELQTWKIPTDKSDLKKLALRISDDYLKDSDPAHELLKRLKRSKEEVTKIYDSLFRKTSSEDSLEAKKLESPLFSPGISDKEIKERLLQLGFRNPDQAIISFKALKNLFPELRFSNKGRRALRKLIPEVILNAKKSPEPDTSLTNFNKFTKTVRMHSFYFTLLKENPQTLKLLMDLFGTSGFFSNFLLKHPELLDSLVLSGASDKCKNSEELKCLVVKKLKGIGTNEERLNALRRIKHQEVLRVAISEIYESIDTRQAMEELTSVAQNMIYGAYLIALKETILKKSVFEEIVTLDQDDKIDFCIIALGKLGNREFSYSSDVDLIFLFDETDNESDFPKLAQKIISVISLATEEGFLYRVDMRLRPSGSQGTLVSSIGSFLNYHEGKSRFWEKQALLKARYICGSKRVWLKALEIIEKTCRSEYDPGIKPQLLKTKESLEKDLASPKSGQYNLKSGKGGLLDLEFALHLLELRYGNKLGKFESLSSEKLLTKFSEQGIIDKTNCKRLLEAYLFMKKLEHRIRLIKDRPVSSFHPESQELVTIAKSFSREYDSETILKLYEQHSDTIRTFFLKVFEEN